MASTEPLLRMEKIDKSFPGVYALDHIDFDLYAGEVHILLGENGAGKSTLVKILSGSIPKDGGRIIIQGKEIHNLTPAYSHELGIGMVYQELSLVPALTVAENIFLGQLPRNKLGMVDWSTMVEQAKESLAELGVSIFYISHHLDEVPLIGQRVTVLRDGRSIGTLPVGEAKRDTLISMMVGRKLTEKYPKKKVELGKVGYKIDSLSVQGKLESV